MADHDHAIPTEVIENGDDIIGLGGSVVRRSGTRRLDPTLLVRGHLMTFGEFSDQLREVFNPHTGAAVKDEDRETFSLDPSGQISAVNVDGERFTCHGARLRVSARHR